MKVCALTVMLACLAAASERRLLQTPTNTDPSACLFTFNDKHFNLNSLKDAILPSIASSTGDGNTYSLNVCGAPVAGCGSAHPSAGCQTSFGNMKSPIGNNAAMSAGLISSNDIELVNNRTVISPKFPPLDWGVTLVFPKLDQQSQDLTIAVPCDPSVTTSVGPLQNLPNVPYLLPTVMGNSRGYFFALPHAAGCPTEDGDGGAAVDIDDSGGDSGMSAGWIFIIVFLCVLTVYCIAGVTYKTQKMGLTGIEAVPNIEFWRDVPQLIQEGCTFTYETFAAVIQGHSSYSADSQWAQQPPAPAPTPSNVNSGAITTSSSNDFALSSYNDL